MGIDITSDRMPEELKNKLANLSSFARKYAEYRAKGLRQPDASLKAGSKAKGRAALGRVGWNTEQLEGVKDYILWLEHKRAKASVIDDLELVDKLREVYDEAMRAGKYNDANKAVELLGNMIGAFAKDKGSNPIAEKHEASSKNDTKAFKEEIEGREVDERVKKLQKMLEDAKQGNAT